MSAMLRTKCSRNIPSKESPFGLLDVSNMIIGERLVPYYCHINWNECDKVNINNNMVIDRMCSKNAGYMMFSPRVPQA